MRNFQKNRIWQNALQSKPVLIFFGVVILVFSWNVFLFWNKMAETERNKNMVEEKVVQLKLQKDKLTADIQSLNTDQGKEKIFRENFGLAKEGEDLIVVVEDKNTPIVPKNESSSGFWSFLKNLFK